MRAGAARVLAFVALAALAACTHRQTPQVTESAYAPAEGCRDCHADVFSKYQHVSMADSLYRPTDANIIEDYRRENHFFHAPSNRYYRMVERQGRFYQQRYQLDQGKHEINFLEEEETYVVGSGNHARSYLHLSPSGELTQLPITWYSQEHRWAMSPGYDKPRHFDFSRPVTYNCIFCHDAYPNLTQAARRYGHELRFSAPLPQGIDCQRCHGPGARHIEVASGANAKPADIRAAILNPARMSADRQLDVCQQCHLETTSAPLPQVLPRFNRAVFSFRPGERLADYEIHFDYPAGTGHDEKFEIVNAAYRLRRSQCFQKSAGRLTCTTCHDPHRTFSGSEAVARYRTACMTCHPQVSGPHPALAGSNCMTCHMPKRRTQDVIHAVMTDHLIQRVKPAGDPLAPLREETAIYHGGLALYDPPQLAEPERSLYLGVALAKDGTDRAAGIGLIERSLGTLRTVPVQAYVELGLAYAAQNNFSKAEADYRKALDLDPDLPMIRYDLGKALAQSGDAQAARQQFEQALQEDPDLPEAHNNLGALLVQAGEIERSIQEFQAAIRERPVYADAHNNLANVYSTHGQLQQAVAEIDESLRDDPDFAPAYNSRGVLFGSQGRLDLAASDFERAVELNPDSIEFRFNLGSALNSLGKIAAAIAQFRRAVALDPRMAPAHLGLGVALAQSRQFVAAEVEFREALRLRPGYPEAQHYLQMLAQIQAGK